MKKKMHIKNKRRGEQESFIDYPQVLVAASAFLANANLFFF